MKTITKKLYEGMFLVDSSIATSDWDGTQASIKNILEKAEAEIVLIKRWDERRLAYDIDGHSRGTYILCYFKVDGERIHDIERDVQLSEQILRVLILCGEHLGEEDIEKADPSMAAEKDKQEASGAAAESAEAEQKGGEEAEEGAEELRQPAEAVGKVPAGTDAGETERAGEKKSDSGQADKADEQPQEEAEDAQAVE